jgi:hypothetical protein
MRRGGKQSGKGIRKGVETQWHLRHPDRIVTPGATVGYRRSPPDAARRQAAHTPGEERAEQKEQEKKEDATRFGIKLRPLSSPFGIKLRPLSSPLSSLLEE